MNQRPDEAMMRSALDGLAHFTAIATAAPVLTDEALDFWGDFFVRNHFHARGILFETFMQHPREIAQAVLFRSPSDEPEEFRLLLPAQRRAIAKPGRRVRAVSRQIMENVCIGCGCTDSHGCLTARGACHWLRVDTARGIGVCSECAALVEAYDAARAGDDLPIKTTGEILAAARTNE